MGVEDLNQGDLALGDSQDVVGEGKAGIRWVRGKTVMPLTYRRRFEEEEEEEI